VSARGATAAAVGVALLALVVAGGACKSKRAHVDGTIAVDSVLAEWKLAGLATGAEAESIKEVEPGPWSAGACSQGQVANLEVLLCEYDSDQALGKGEEQINNEWAQATAGVTTGVVVRAKRTLLAVTDHAGADKSGQTIVKLLKSFRAQN
jgi:hypothetical protein